MTDDSDRLAEISDLIHDIRTHYQLAIWYAVRALPIESADEQGKADEAARRAFEITDARGQ